MEILKEINSQAHTLRNLTAGSSIEQVTDHLGHEDIQTTRKWQARIINAKRRPEVEKMDNLSRYVMMEPSMLVDNPTAQEVFVLSIELQGQIIDFIDDKVEKYINIFAGLKLQVDNYGDTSISN